MFGVLRLSCLLLVALLPLPRPPLEEGYLELYVKNAADKRVSNVVVTCQDGRCSTGISDSRGKARLKLASQMNSDDWVSLQIVTRKGSLHWVLLSPWDDRVNVPSFTDKAENITDIVVALHGDKEILRSGVALRALTERCNGRVQPKAGPQITDEDRQLARKAQAEAVGLTPEDLDQAIREWGRRAKDPYERGLVEFYEKNYSKAEELLKESQAIQKETFQKEKAKLANTTTFLGQSLYLQGKFGEAVVAFREVTELKGDALLPLIWLGSGLLAIDENSEAEQVFKRALINSEQAYGANAPVAAPILASLTVLSTLQGKYDEAKKYSEKAGVIVGKFSSQESIFTFLNKIASAELNKSQGRYAEAESFYKDAVAYTEKLIAICSCLRPIESRHCQFSIIHYGQK